MDQKRDAHAAYKAGVEIGISRGVENVEKKDRVMVAYIIGVFFLIAVTISLIVYSNVNKRKSPPLPPKKYEKVMERYYSGGFRSER